ncbi:transcription termination factor, mitochondrial [Drosophila hydei]|uniref:Transcription termination factor, mitochondrial n=1 Tax=Drosophila hydei TaxID=7224 RepID=A0A6J1M2A0_DROHY|nr:transcription termination factor, mitochondrial [Drosophila hydei]XP_023172314.1 transcription termination factor, mitochondrial [Drosophila hydei]
MLRNLTRSFDSVLKLQRQTYPHAVRLLHTTDLSRALFTQYACEGRLSNKQPTLAATAGISIHATPTASEADNEYVPYRTELESGSRVSVLIAALRERFRLTEKEVERIVSDEQVHRSYRNRCLTHVLDTLLLEGVTKQSFVEYPWLLVLDQKRLQLKLELLKSMHMLDINHFVPFLRLTLPRLRKLVSVLNAETNEYPQKNRVYYISDKLGVSPEIVTKYLSKRLFILEMPYEMFEKNLEHMIHYNVSPINILKDLWAFRYTPKSVELRLERAQRAKKDKIMPWMVRCPEPILQRSLKLTLDELQVLGEFSSVVEYVAHRLGFSVSETKAIMDRHPQVHTVRVTKIKEVLDYLLDVAKFTRFEIAQVPRILCHSLKTTRQRMEELESIGCRPSTLVILCRSRREYDKFLQQWNDQRGTPKQINSS